MGELWSQFFPSKKVKFTEKSLSDQSGKHELIYTGKDLTSCADVPQAKSI